MSSSLLRLFSLFALLSTLTILAITAQEVSTAPVDLTCLDNSVYSYTPSQAAEGFCTASQQPNCQDAFVMGYPNSYGPVGGNANTGPYTFAQYITQSPLWVVISDSYGKPAYKTRFFLQVDRYSLLELGGTAGDDRFDVALFEDNASIDNFNALLINGTKITAEFSGWATTATRRAYVPESTTTDAELPTNEDRRIVDFYTLVIELDRGVVSDFFWEKGCYGCSNSACWDEEEWCTIPYSDCSVVNTAGGGASCNIKLYVAWRGTDSKGNYLISAQQTMKNFLQFDVTSPFDDARNAFDKLGPNEEDIY